MLIYDGIRLQILKCN